MTKVCRTCGKEKKLSLFHVSTNKGGRSTQCSKCKSLEQAAKKYKVSIAEIKKLRKRGRCHICANKARNLVIDHNHETGEIRGLLCHHCNVALGFFRDNLAWVLSAAEYLRITDPHAVLELQKTQLALLGLFAVVNDVMEEPDAFSDEKLKPSLGRIYREWLNARSQLDPEFDKERFRHQMKSSKSSHTPNRKPLASASQNSSTGTTKTSAKSGSRSGSTGKRTASRSARNAR